MVMGLLFGVLEIATFPRPYTDRQECNDIHAVNACLPHWHDKMQDPKTDQESCAHACIFVLKTAEVLLDFHQLYLFQQRSPAECLQVQTARAVSAGNIKHFLPPGSASKQTTQTYQDRHTSHPINHKPPKCPILIYTTVSISSTCIFFQNLG